MDRQDRGCAWGELGFHAAVIYGRRLKPVDRVGNGKKKIELHTDAHTWTQNFFGSMQTGHTVFLSYILGVVLFEPHRFEPLVESEHAFSACPNSSNSRCDGSRKHGGTII